VWQVPQTQTLTAHPHPPQARKIERVLQPLVAQCATLKAGHKEAKAEAKKTAKGVQAGQKMLEGLQDTLQVALLQRVCVHGVLFTAVHCC
jgi:hypothetical protein